jgi:hypothetical protein
VSDEECNNKERGKDLLGFVKGGGLKDDVVGNCCSDCALHSPPSSSALSRDLGLGRGLLLKNDDSDGEPRNPGDFFPSWGDFISCSR